MDTDINTDGNAGKTGGEPVCAIPRRPANDADFGYKIKSDEKDIMLVKYLLGYSNSKAFALFHPEYCDGPGGKLGRAGQVAARQLFTHPASEAWMRSYADTLSRWVRGQGGVMPDGADGIEIGETRKDMALKNLLDKAISLVENREATLDADTLKTVSEIFKKLGLLKDDEAVQEAPRRYLPVRCVSECRYRAFVEDGLKQGYIADECGRCRAKAFAVEHGFKYDPTRALEPIIDNQNTKQP